MRMKKYLLLFISIFIVNIFGPVEVNAGDHKLENLEIEVFIKPDGSAIIKEKRKAHLIDGTENYIVINSLGESTISNFKVTENGKIYKNIGEWDVDVSREEKAFKNGVIETDIGYELCWGIGEYGSHEYVLEYTVTDFIKELDDGQILLWKFVNDGTNIPPQKVTLSITSDINFNEEDQKVWAFGFDGDVNFIDGKVIAKSSQPLRVEDYFTILLKLDKGSFATGDHIDKTFEEVKEAALYGSDYGIDDEYSDSYDDYYSDGNSGEDKFWIVIMGFFTAVFAIVTGISLSNPQNRPGVFKRKFQGEYHRDYPYEGEILDIYYILYKMGLASFNNILTGFILKWINEDRIITISEEVGSIIKREKTNIRILNRELPEDPLEAELFEMIMSASEGKEIIEEKAFTNWARKNYTSIDAWEKKVKERSINKLESMGYIEIKKVKKFIFTIKEHNLIYTGLQVETNMYKYINYLSDYSLLNEHEAINVKIWDNIMVWAGFLGIAEAVSKQFEKIHPEYRDETIYRGNSIYLASALTHNISSARSSASQGAGGSSSMGGGGGSFGGGSGGGTR